MKYLETREIPLDQIEHNEYRLREETRRKPLKGLVHSIDQYGLVHPIVVRRTPNEARPYCLVAGERRLLAHEKLQRELIRADIWEASNEEAQKSEVFDRTAEMMTVISNVQVEPLHPFEKGRRYLKWMEEFGMSEQDIATALDVTGSDVRAAIHPVQRIAPEALEVIEKNPDKIQPHHINLLADEAERTPPEGQMRIVKAIIEQEDKVLAQSPAKLPDVARAVRRDLRRERREREASAAEQEKPQHTDEFKRKKLFDFVKASEDAVSAFREAEIPEKMSLVDLKSLEARGERLGRAWPQVVKALIEAVEKSASAQALAEESREPAVTASAGGRSAP